MRTRSAVVFAVLAVVATACGSTVQTSQSTVGVGPNGVTSTQGATSGGDSSLSVPGATAGTGTGSSAGSSFSGSTTGTGTGAAVGGGTTSTGTSTTPGSGRSTDQGGQPAVSAPGVTPTTMYYGMIYSSQAGGADRAVGATGSAPSYDYRNVMNSIIDYANKHGGFAGRNLKAIYYDINLTNPRASEDAAACARFTEDNKVFAMYGQTDELRACAEKAGAVSLQSGSETASTFRKYPHFVDPNGIRLDRLGPVTVGGLDKAHYFTGKLGLITWDDPNYHYTMDNGYLPALAAHHVKPAAPVVYISEPQTVGAIADMSAQVSSAVTKFRSLGVDHVIIQDGQAGVFANGGLTLEFMNNAKSQHYYPRYGANAANLPGNSDFPADEQNHELAILDTDDAPQYDAGWHSNAQRDKCFKIEADAGYPVSESNSNDETLAAQTCDAIFFLQTVVNQLSVLSPDSFVRQVTTLGTAFKPASVYGTRLFPGRLDGSDQVRTAEYFQSCNCLKYSGAPYQPD